MTLPFLVTLVLSLVGLIGVDGGNNVLLIREFDEPKYELTTSKGILEPGGEFIGTDGITIAAGPGVLAKAGEVFINKVPQPIEQIEDEWGVTPVGAYYEIGATNILSTTAQGTLRISFSVPEGFTADQIAIFELAPNYAFSHSNGDPNALVWFPQQVNGGEEGKIAFSTSVLRPEGKTYILAYIND